MFLCSPHVHILSTSPINQSWWVKRRAFNCSHGLSDTKCSTSGLGRLVVWLPAVSLLVANDAAVPPTPVADSTWAVRVMMEQYFTRHVCHLCERNQRRRRWGRDKSVVWSWAHLAEHVHKVQGTMGWLWCWCWWWWSCPQSQRCIISIVRVIGNLSKATPCSPSELSLLGFRGICPASHSLCCDALPWMKPLQSRE